MNSSCQNKIPIMKSSDRWVLAVTGASGIIYALRLMQELSKRIAELHVVFSDAALRVLADEHDLKLSQSKLSCAELFSVLDQSADCASGDYENICFHNPKDIGAQIASGSAIFKGMLVVPCSMGSLASIANGLSSNLIHRAADVTIKEGRKLLLVPRETPLSAIHLENMLKLSRLGVTILPAMPAFYLKPKSINDLVDHLVLKVLDNLGIYSEYAPRWTGK